MIFHFNERGEPLGFVPEQIVSGSISSKKIFFVCPINEGNVVSVSFLLANGTQSNTHTLTPIDDYTNLSVTDSVGLPCAIYSMDIPGTVIANAGEVSVQFFITDSNGNKIATPISKFTVEEGLSATTPDESDSYDDLITLVSRLGTVTANLRNELNLVSTTNIASGTGEGSVMQNYVDDDDVTHGSTANGVLSVALGESTTADADNTLACGENTVASAKNQTVVGMNNDTDDDALFIVGNGTDQANKNNAFSVLNTGDVIIDNDLDVNGTLNAEGDSVFSGEATFDSNLSVNADATVGGDLSVTGDISADNITASGSITTDDATIGGDLSVTGDISAENISASGSLSVDGESVATLGEDLVDGELLSYDAENGKLVSVSLNKQDTLISGTNIKTVNGESLLGSGNITVPTGTAVSGVNDGSNWTSLTIGGTTKNISAGGIKSISVPKGGGAITSSTTLTTDENGNVEIPVAQFISGMGVDGCRPGLVWLNRDFQCGLKIPNGNGNIQLWNPADSQRQTKISIRSNDLLALMPKDINPIVKAALTDDNRMSLTLSEKAKACDVLGAGRTTLYKHTFTISFFEPIEQNSYSTTMSVLSKNAVAYEDGVAFISDLCNNNVIDVRNVAGIDIDGDYSGKDILYGGYAYGTGAYIVLTANVNGGIDNTYKIITMGATIGADVVTAFSDLV